jgi:hypothetical protein
MNTRTELGAERARDAHLAAKALDAIVAGVPLEEIDTEELVSLTDQMTFIVWEKENEPE